MRAAAPVSSDGSADTAVGYGSMSADIGPFSTATEMLAALDAKDISSVELVEMHLARIDKHDDALERDPCAHAKNARSTRHSAPTQRVPPASAAAPSGCP